MAEGKPRKSQARGISRVDAILDAAADMSLEAGYEALSIDAVIGRAGGSRRNIYDHFGGKQGLFVEAITRRCSELGAPLRDLRIDSGEGDLEKSLATFGYALISIVLSRETLTFHRLMVAEGARFPAMAQRMWHAGHDSAAQILSTWIDAQQRAGLLHGGVDPHRLAQQFISMVIADAQLYALTGFGDIDEGSRLARVRDATKTLLFGHAING